MMTMQSIYRNINQTHMKYTYLATAATFVGVLYFNSKVRDDLIANSALIGLGVITQLLANALSSDYFNGYGKKLINDFSSKLSFISTYIMIGNWVVSAMEKNYGTAFCKGLASVVGRFFASNILYEKNKVFNPDMHESDRFGQVFRIVGPLVLQEAIRLYNPEGSLFAASTILNCGIYFASRTVGDVLADAKFDSANLGAALEKRKTRPAFYIAEYYASKSLFLFYGNPDLKDSLFLSNLVVSGYRAAYEILFIVPLIAEPVTKKVLDLLKGFTQNQERQELKLD